MKVKEYIEELKKLDPEKNIYQANADYSSAITIAIPEAITQDDVDFYELEEEGELHIGDYFVFDLR
jgi:hypothetical protein